MAFSLFERWSPEFALSNTFDDMKESGLDGLQKHLTSNALRTVERIEALSEMPEVSMITTAVIGGFNYQDKMVGTIELTLIKEESTWKIDHLGMPKFDKLTLPQGKEDQPAES